MGNPVVYFEIGAADDAVLQRFYAELFGWKLESIPPGGYTSVDTQAGGGLRGGIGRSSDGTPWATFYVETDDLQATLDKAVSLGANTVMGVTDIPGVVSFAMFTDPDGSLVGLMKPVPGGLFSTKATAGDRPAIDWFEVLGSDGQRTFGFYKELFGWTANGPGPYWLVDTGAGRGISGGVGAGGESRWATIYAHVPDVAAALAKAEALGGKWEYGPNAVDDHMRTGAFRDPAGNVVGVYEHKH